MTTLFRTIGFMLRLAYRIDRRRLARASVLLAIGYLSVPLVALSVRGMAESALEHRSTAAAVLALAVAALLVFELMMNHFAHLQYFEIGEQAEVALNNELTAAMSDPGGIEHLDSAEVAD